MFEEFKFLSDTAGTHYIAAASMVNGPVLDTKEMLRRLDTARHAFAESMPLYFKVGASKAGQADVDKLVAEFHKRKEELETKASEFKPQT